MASPHPPVAPGMSLSDFQRRIDEAIAAPEVSVEAFVALRVADQRWVVDLTYLSETSVPPPLARTGRCPPWVVGIGSFRGQVRTVVDMHHVLVGVRSLAVEPGWATPLNERRGEALALLWPQMEGLIGRLDLTAIAPQPGRRWERARWRDAQGHEWSEFDVESFVVSDWVNDTGGEVPHPEPHPDVLNQVNHG